MKQDRVVETPCPKCRGRGRIEKRGPIAFGDRLTRRCGACQGAHVQSVK